MRGEDGAKNVLRLCQVSSLLPSVRRAVTPILQGGLSRR
jgi:hypothetical protein